MPETQPSIFVSYAHEDAGLAHALAKELEAAGARVWLDKGELLIGDSLLERIAEAIEEFEFVAALVSHSSVESNWCRKEIALAMNQQLTRGNRRVKVLPLRVGKVAMPPSLTDMMWVDLSEANLSECARRLVSDASVHLNSGQRPPRAPGAPRRQRPAGPSSRSDDGSPVKIVGVDTENMGVPRNDGTQGSVLYRVPLKLNRVPHPLWSSAFPRAWDSPRAWTSMHRPGIGSVQGDRIVLDGTTIEEVRDYHLKTLKLVVKDLNQRLEEHLERERRAREAQEIALAEHERVIRETAEQLDFDED